MGSRTVVAIVLASLGLAIGAGCFWPLSGREAGLQLPGIVEIQEVRLGSKVGGRVALVQVAEGDLIEPGQLLVRFDVPELQAQRDRVRSKLAAAEAELTKAKNGPRPEEIEAAAAAHEAAQARLQRLKTGWREEEIRQAQSDLEAAQADWKLAREEFERVSRLFKQRSMSKTDLDQAEASRSRAEGLVGSARAHFEMLSEGSRIEDIDEAAAEVKRAQANLNLLKAGTRAEDIAVAESTVAEIRANLAEIETNLREADVVAPERAVVEVVSVRPGDLVAPGQPVLRVLRAGDLWVRVYAPETVLGQVRLDQEASVTIDAYPDRRFTGKVVQIAAISEFTPRNVQSLEQRRHQVFGVKVLVVDPGGIFKAGMAAQVVLKPGAPP